MEFKVNVDKTRREREKVQKVNEVKGSVFITTPKPFILHFATLDDFDFPFGVKLSGFIRSKKSREDSQRND